MPYKSPEQLNLFGYDCFIGKVHFPENWATYFVNASNSWSTGSFSTISWLAKALVWVLEKGKKPLIALSPWYLWPKTLDEDQISQVLLNTNIWDPEAIDGILELLDSPFKSLTLPGRIYQVLDFEELNALQDKFYADPGSEYVPDPFEDQPDITNNSIQIQNRN